MSRRFAATFAVLAVGLAAVVTTSGSFAAQPHAGGPPAPVARAAPSPRFAPPAGRIYTGPRVAVPNQQHHHHHHRRYAYVPYAPLLVIPSRCGWLRERAEDTGSRYWWHRYRECLED